MHTKTRKKHRKTPPSAGSRADPPPREASESRAKRRPRRPSAEETLVRLLEQLQITKAAAQDVVEQLSLRLTSQLAEVSRRLELGARSDGPPPAIPAKRASAMLAVLRKLRLKPRKGRVKDLERIEQAVEKLLALTASKS